ncbi:ribonuclease P protein component [Nitrosomonas ureae]|uniref:ribonuclease P protein component n=1 Tax=Nitrosomonas ureae TaxID=44577 RepID=UPI000721F5B5|nr:ribonuclease P protein component [Nitrosomonas ureae]
MFFIFRFAEIQSLPKNCRLHKASEFAAIINFKCQLSGDLLQIYTKPNGLGYARLGLIVSKKFERHATRRNRIKRILRETFRRKRGGDKIKEMDWLIRLRRPMIKSESKGLVTEMQLLMLELSDVTINN